MSSEKNLRELISTIDRADCENQPLGEELRGQLISKLKACVADKDRLDAYVRVVEQLAAESMREGTLPQAREKLVVERGPSVLADDELIHLALSEDALVNLCSQIKPNEYWTASHVHAAEVELLAILRRLGVRVPHRE